MPKLLSIEEITALARLAKLTLSDDEIAQYQKELSSILEYVALLSDADTEGLQPTSQVTGLTNVMRADKVMELTATPDELVKRAPDSDGRYLKVKRMI